MAFATITLTNGIEVKTAPIGFSWTTFFFGGIPALIRQDWLMGLLIIIGNIFTWGIVALVFSFIYNKMYVKGLIEKGYKIQTLPANLTAERLQSYLGFVKLPMAE